ncbi:MAG: hypothetical protein K6C32_02355 [Bacilli bacterium]|nr:hypothetical protein [Bacilli bacterium]
MFLIKGIFKLIAFLLGLVGIALLTFVNLNRFVFHWVDMTMGVFVVCIVAGAILCLLSIVFSKIGKKR